MGDGHSTHSAIPLVHTNFNFSLKTNNEYKVVHVINVHTFTDYKQFNVGGYLIADSLGMCGSK